MSVLLKVGSRAPDFTLEDQNGQPVHLAERARQNVIVLFFYPRDNSAGCTMEACAFRDSYEDFKDAGADVIGISGGTVEGKQEFVSKHRLPFTLVNDPETAVATTYGINKGLWGGFGAGRVTYVIDREGIIRYAFESRVNMDAHAREALKMVRELARETVR
jgi:peroxiredoxin Q/BCP